jgi:hypothetical protein
MGPVPAGRACLLWVAILPLLSGFTCQSGNSRPVMADSDLPSGPPKSLRETFDHLRDAYQRRAYLALRPYMDPAHRDQAIDMLLAVDNLLAANSAVLKVLECVSPQTPRARLDISGVITANLEIFSKEVEVLSQHEDREAGRATLTIEIAGTPPPVDVHFRLREGHWVYVPGSAGGAEMIQALRELTKALERVARSLAVSGNASPEQALKEYQLFVLPKLRAMARVAAG